MKNNFQSKSVPRGTRTIWRYLSALFILFTFAVGNVWGTSYIPGDCKVVTANETIDYATIAGANATTSGKWIVNPRGGTTSSKKYTNLTSDTKGNPDGIVDNIATITSNVNMATIQVPSTAKYNQSGKYVIHMRITGITGIIAHGVTGSSGRGCAIYGQEYSTSLTENTGYGSALASMTRSGNSGSFLLQYTGFTASKEYLITIAATGGDDQLYAIELIAGATTTYTVTYKPGAGSGTDVVDTDAKTVAGCPTQFSYTGYDFAGWKDSDNNDVEVGATVTSDMTLTAQWTVHVDKYTVKYMDGTTVLGTEQVNVNSTPVGLAEDPKKDCYTFAAWSPALNTISGEKDDVVEVSATWTAVYSSSATLISDDVKNDKPNVNTVFAASNIVSSITFTSGNYEFTSNETKKGYYGYKDKASGDYMKILVQQGKRVQVLFGNLGADPTIKINGANGALDAARLTGDNAENTFTYNASSADALVSITMGSGTNTLKSVTIEDIPALDDDATLKDLKVGGTTISGFSANTHTYYYVLPYGTTVENMPVIAATANSTKAKQVAIQQAVWTDAPYNCYRAQANVEAEDGSWGYYDVRFSFDKKQGVQLIKATTQKVVTGYIGGEAVLTKSGEDKSGNTYKLDKNVVFGFTLAGDENVTFAEGDVFIMNITTAPGSATNMGTMKVYDAPDATTPIYESDEVGSVGLNYWTLPAAAAGKKSLYIKRGDNDDWNPTFSYVEVQRYMAPFIESFEIAGIGALTINGTNITAEVSQDFDVTALTPTIKAWANGGATVTPTSAQNFTSPVVYTINSAYPTEDAAVQYTVTITKVVPSATPSITAQPASANYYEGASIAALSVVAETEDNGTLTYQWYLGADAINGATAATYQPTVSAIGSYSYTCVVTNKKDDKPAASVTSNAAVVVIAEDPSCKAVGYGTTRDLALNSEVVIDATAGLKHKSSQSSYDTKKIAGESSLKTNKLGSSSAYYDIYTTEKNIGSIALSLTSGSNGSNLKYAVIFCKTAEFDASKILGIVEQTGGAGDEEQVINTPEVPLGTKLVRVMRYYKDADNNEYGQGSSSYIYYFRACLVEPAQEVSATVTAEPAGATYCPSDAVAALSYELSIEDGASAAYQWYKGTEAIEGATAATYTPSETGVYTCKAALTKTGRLPKELTSAEATIVINTATAITSAPQNQRGIVDAVKTLTVAAEGTNLTYAWYTCDDANGANPEAVVPAATEASLNVTITAGMHQYYKVVVTGACGTEEAVALVEEWALVEQADVTGYMKWDWNKTTNANAWNGVANIQLSGADKTTDFIMANTSSTMPNNGYFRSDMLVVNGEYPARPTQDGGVFQGYAVKFHTTVPGKVIVTYRGTGGSVDVNLVINNQEVGTEHDWHTKYVVVPAGDVTITEKEGGVLRIRSIEFVVEADHERDVVIGNMGTVCLPNPSRAFGVKVYELAGKGEGCKVQFDELAENEVLEAGKAYVLVMTDTKAKFFYTSTSNPKTEANDNSAMKGNLSTTAIEFAPYAEAARNVVFFKDNAMWNAYETGLKVKQYRAYLQYDEVGVTTASPAPGRRRVTLDMHGQNTATGMDELNASETPVKVLINGQIYIIRGEKMYDATGKLVK